MNNFDFDSAIRELYMEDINAGETIMTTIQSIEDLVGEGLTEREKLIVYSVYLGTVKIMNENSELEFSLN